MEQVIKSAEESVSRVLKFYKDRGTPLSYSPRLEYVDGICPQRHDALAMIRQEFETLDKYSDFLYQNLGRTVWKDAYNIDVSDEAIAEVTRIQKDKLGKILIPQEFDSGADVLIFQPYQNHCREQNDGDEIMAHEIWHLIEKERGVLQEHPFIMEGTATYAMRRFRGKSCNKPFEKFDDFFMMMYLGAANVVQGYVESSENPYQTMLNKQVREQIQQDLLGRVRPVLVERIKKSLEDEDNQRDMAHTMRQTPEFQGLEGNLTAEGIVEAYRQMGATKLADELQGKDLEGLMDWFRMAGF